VDAAAAWIYRGVWAGIVAVLVGGGLLFFPAGKRI